VGLSEDRSHHHGRLHRHRFSYLEDESVTGTAAHERRAKAARESLIMSLQKLTEQLESELRPHDFQRLDEASSSLDLNNRAFVQALWKRKTWNTNRGVALLELNQGLDSPEAFVRAVRDPIGKAIGYLPVLYPLGLQLILAGEGIYQEQSGLGAVLSKIDNQTVVLQSIHVVDLHGLSSASARTWGQVLTGRYQDAIERGIQGFLQSTVRA
jgi:hypothetical protein